MAPRELPIVDARRPRAGGDANGATGVNQGERGAAHTRTRDAYRDVPILIKPTWGQDIVAYFFLGGVSSGAFVFGALAEALGGTRRKRMARVANYVAFATMLPCPPFLIHDLGRPGRFYHMLRIFKPSSPMNLGSWALTLHGTFATLTAMRALAADDKLPFVGPIARAVPAAPLGLVGIPGALTLGGYTGVLLGTSSVPVWFTSPLLGGLFTASALSTGTAAVTLVDTLVEGEADHTLTPLRLTLGAVEAIALGAYLATSGKAAKPLLRGAMGLLTAGAVTGIVAGVALEAASLGAKKPNRLLGVAAPVATLLGGAALRWGVVFAGHTSALDREGTIESTTPSERAPGWGP